MTRFLMTLACTAGLLGAACNRESPAPAQVPVPEAVREAAQAAASNPAPARPADKSVDACALLAESDAAAVIGKLAGPPQADKPQGSLLGTCNFTGEQATVALSAYPAEEFDGTLRYARKHETTREIAGVGESAFDTSSGVLVRLAGKPYFLVVFVVKGTAYDPPMAEALARKLKL
ncbi:MAG TPA: hypothetical protein VM074_03050 [Solimonas sp.]|nr:hypothetical protein [Solimonas sp.]